MDTLIKYQEGDEEAVKKRFWQQCKIGQPDTTQLVRFLYELASNHYMIGLLVGRERWDGTMNAPTGARYYTLYTADREKFYKRIQEFCDSFGLQVAVECVEYPAINKTYRLRCAALVIRHMGRVIWCSTPDAVTL